jgi:16S rRNA A1518/A1519 N6-dimethyltransferase RsmA/KsgA/DIM1 with predicted DNA glycosylase/AP lyase activity
MLKHSQNFINNTKILDECFKHVSIPGGQLVIEIGGGKGIITDKLMERFEKVTVIEYDNNLFQTLQKKYAPHSKIRIINENFLAYPLPTEDFNIVANIPFNITSGIIRKITGPDSCMQHAYLIMQKAAALKFVAERQGSETSLLSNLIQVRYAIHFLLSINRNNFSPQPKFDASFIHFERKQNNVFLNKDQEETFNDFLCFVFNRTKPIVADAIADILPKKIVNHILQKSKIKLNQRIKTLQFEEWVTIFKNIDFTSNTRAAMIIGGAHRKLIKEQKNLQKIHRTRKY